VQGPPPSPAPRTLLNPARQVFIRAPFWSLGPGRPHWARPRRATPPAGASGLGGTTQRDVLAPAPAQRLPLGRCPKLLEGGTPRLDPEPALVPALGQGGKEVRATLCPRRAKAGAAHQADPHPAEQDHGREGGDAVGLPRPLSPRAVAFAHQGTPLLVGPQPGHGRGVEGLDGPPLLAPAHRLDGHALQRHQLSARSHSVSSATFPRSRTRSTRGQPQRQWTT
jgi:hypothetical protein